jgi:hypothetical protein
MRCVLARFSPRPYRCSRAQKCCRMPTQMPNIGTEGNQNREVRRRLVRSHSSLGQRPLGFGIIAWSASSVSTISFSRQSEAPIL